MESLLPPGNQLSKMEDCSNSSHQVPSHTDLWRGDGIKGEEAVVAMVSEFRIGDSHWECCFGMCCPSDASKECPGVPISFCPCNLGGLRKWPSQSSFEVWGPKAPPQKSLLLHYPESSRKGSYSQQVPSHPCGNVQNRLMSCKLH